MSASSSASNASFKGEFRENPVTLSAPEIMKFRPVINGGALPLTGDEFKEALSALYNKSYVNLKYPRVQRFRVDPNINSQNQVCLHSFTPSPGATPDKDGCFGVLKFRGAFPSIQEADAWAEHLIRTVDSINEIHMSHVGREFPLTMEPLYFNETHEIDMKKKMDDIARAHAKSVREKEEEDVRTIKGREEELLKTSDMTNEEVNTSLDHYIAMKVKAANILLVRDEALKKLELYEKTRLDTMKEVYALDSQFPEYKEKYLEKFMKSLTDIGVKDTPLLKYMNEM